MQTEIGPVIRCLRAERVVLTFLFTQSSDPDEISRRMKSITVEQAQAVAWLAGQDTATVNALLSLLGREPLSDKAFDA